jgi:hypothetical protein
MTSLGQYRISVEVNVCVPHSHVWAAGWLIHPAERRVFLPVHHRIQKHKLENTNTSMPRSIPMHFDFSAIRSAFGQSRDEHGFRTK